MKREHGAGWVGDSLGSFSSGQGTPGRHKVMGTWEGTGHWAPRKTEGTGDSGRRRALGTRETQGTGGLGRNRALGTQGRKRALGTQGHAGHWEPGETQGTGDPGDTGHWGPIKAQGAQRRSAQNIEKLCHRQ